MKCEEKCFAEFLRRKFLCVPWKLPNHAMCIRVLLQGVPLSCQVQICRDTIGDGCPRGNAIIFLKRCNNEAENSLDPLMRKGRNLERRQIFVGMWEEKTIFENSYAKIQFNSVDLSVI